MRLLAVTCHLHFRQNDQDLLLATAVTRGWTDIEIKSAQKADPEENNSPAASAGTQTSLPPFNHESVAPTTELSPLPSRACLYGVQLPPPPHPATSLSLSLSLSLWC